MKLYRHVHGALKKRGINEWQEVVRGYWAPVSALAQRRIENYGEALLQLEAARDDPRAGFTTSYHLYRDPWPERTLADLLEDRPWQERED